MEWHKTEVSWENWCKRSWSSAARKRISSCRKLKLCAADLIPLHVDRGSDPGLFNILNAIRYTVPPGNQNQRRSGRRDGENISCRHRVGAPKIAVDFERFYRVGKTLKILRNRAGLAIARKVVEAHGGSLVESSPGKEPPSGYPARKAQGRRW